MRSEAPASAKAAGNGYPLRLPPPRQSSTLHKSGRYPRQANPQPPHGAAADFDLLRLENGAEVARDRWTVSLQFTFLDAVDPELMIVNPMGIIVTFLRAEPVLVSP